MECNRISLLRIILFNLFHWHAVPNINITRAIYKEEFLWKWFYFDSYSNGYRLKQLVYLKSSWWKDYRVYDLVERISTGGRAFYYGLAPNEYHKAHPHFYCKSCGQMDCLSPESLTVDTDHLLKTYPGRIEKVEIRIDGTCKNCEKVGVNEKMTVGGSQPNKP